MRTFLLIALSTFVAVLAGLLVLNPKLSLADEAVWNMYLSDTELFKVKLPGSPDESTVQFRVSPGLIINSSEVAAFIDQRPYLNLIKNFLIEMDQSFGPAISSESRIEIVKREIEEYEESFKDRNPKVYNKSVSDVNETTHGNITLIYDDAEDGYQAARLKVILNKVTMIHMMYTGPSRDLDDLDTENFFKSLSAETGFALKEGDINSDWRRIESPFSLFAVKVPPVSPPYFMHEPSITVNGNIEKMGMVFSDPLWRQNIFYNIKGYELNVDTEFGIVEELLLKDYLHKHGRMGGGIKFTKTFAGNIPYIETHYAIRGPGELNYINYVKLRAMFLGNYVMVQELMGPKHLVETDFVASFFNLVEFTPKKAYRKAREIRRKQKEQAQGGL